MTFAQRRSLVAQRMGTLEVSGVRQMMSIADKLSDAIRLEVGEPDFDTPGYIIEAVKADLDRGLFTHYTPVSGYAELRRALAAKLRADIGVEYDPASQVMVSVGGASALLCAILASVDPGDEVLIADPSYPQYKQHIILAGARPVYYPLYPERGFMPDLAEVRALLTPRSKVILLNSPQNPTGSVLDPATLAGLAALAREFDLLVVADDVYSLLVYEGHEYRAMASLPGMAERTITIKSFSKEYAMTGWRLGYAAGPQPLLAEMIKLQGLVNSCASSVSQRAGLAALSQDDDSLRMRAAFQARRDWFVNALNELPGFVCQCPGGAFYVFPDIRAFGLPSHEFTMRLLRAARVTSVWGSAYGPMGEGHIRFSYATSLDLLRQAVERIGEALPELRA